MVNDAGACGAGYLDQSTAADTERCADACMNQTSCEYFAFGAEKKDCFLFTASGCPTDERFPQYKSFRMLRQHAVANGAEVQANPSPSLASTGKNKQAGSTSTSLVLPIADVNGSVVDHMRKTGHLVADYSQHACIRALMKTGLFIGGSLFPFARNYRTTGCFYYLHGALGNRGFYGTIRGQDVQDAFEATAIAANSSLLARPAGYPRMYVTSAPASCHPFDKRVKGCSKYGDAWIKLADDISEFRCSERCLEAMSQHGRLCCYWSQTRGCWSKPNALPTSNGTGSSLECDHPSAEGAAAAP